MSQTDGLKLVVLVLSLYLFSQRAACLARVVTLSENCYISESDHDSQGGEKKHV
jgi:hypothetical protein